MCEMKNRNIGQSVVTLPKLPPYAQKPVQGIIQT